MASGLYRLNEYWISERGARLARRDDREYREYLREEQRRQPGCLARKTVLIQPIPAARTDVGQGFSPARHLLTLVVLACLASGCEDRVKRAAMQITGGDPARAAAAVRKYGCGSCHTIPGIDGANAVVGPPLDRLGRRSYIAGHLSNNADVLVRWIRHPHSFKQETAMPEMGVGEQEARDIAAYLYTLQ